MASLLGYDYGVIGAALDSIRVFFHVSPSELGWLVGIYTLFSVIASPISGLLGDYLGRRTVLGTASVIAASGTLLCAAASSYTVLVAGRAITGFGVGAGIAQAPTYVAELAPAHERGYHTTQIEVFLNAGMVMGFVTGLLTVRLGSPWDFRIMCGLGVLPTLLLIFLLPRAPESPRWLLSRGLDAEAMASLRCALVPEEEAQHTMREMRRELADEQTSSWGVLQHLSETATYQSFAVSMALSVCMAGSGVDVIMYYSGAILQASGLHDEADLRCCLVLMGIIKTFMVVLASWSIDRVGRRPLLMASCAGMSCAGFLLLVPGLCSRYVPFTLAGIMSSLGCFGFGLGPSYYTMISEVWPTHMRSLGASWSNAVSSILSCIIQCSFYTAVQFMSIAGTMSLFSACSLLSVFLVHYAIPETSGRSLEEINSTRRQSLVDLSLEGVADVRKRHSQTTVLSAQSWQLSSSPGAWQRGTSDEELLTQQHKRSQG